MIGNFEIVGYCCLIFAFVIYITNFKEINKEIIHGWCKAIQEGREQYYLEMYPRGYCSVKSYKRIDNFYYQAMSRQHYYKDMLYNRKMMEK